jgi:hypothetical protein
MKQFVAPVAVSVLLGGCATTGKPVPGGHTRNVVVMEVGKVHDPVAFSGQLVDVAKRCWIGKNEAFSGLDVQGVGPWSEIPDTPSSTIGQTPSGDLCWSNQRGNSLEYRVPGDGRTDRCRGSQIHHHVRS